MRDEVVPDHISRFKESVNCDRRYNADGWDEVAPNREIAPMWHVADMSFPGWSLAPGREPGDIPSFGCSNVCGSGGVEPSVTYVDPVARAQMSCGELSDYCATNTNPAHCSSGNCRELEGWLRSNTGCCLSAVSSATTTGTAVIALACIGVSVM